MYEYDEQNDVLRKQNRALRSVNKQLRKLLKRTQEESDAIFIALCDTVPMIEEQEQV